MGLFKKILSYIMSKLTPLPPTTTNTTSPSLWIPFAAIPARKMPTTSTYANNYPLGAVVHFTAGRDTSEKEALDSYNWGCEQGYTYLLIGPTGKLYQGFALNKSGPHAGKSHYKGLGIGVSTKLLGIEIACAGDLDENGKSWFGVTYPPEEIRKGFRKYTPEQEETLIKTLVWLKKNNPEIFNVEYILGHNEVSPNRKTDPGHSLSMSMPELREKIKRLTADPI